MSKSCPYSSPWKGVKYIDNSKQAANEPAASEIDGPVFKREKWMDRRYHSI